MVSNADALRALVSEIHRLADAGSYWACGDLQAPELSRARIRTLAREALALLPAEDRAPTCATCRHFINAGGSAVGQCDAPLSVSPIKDQHIWMATANAWGCTAWEPDSPAREGAQPT